MAPPGVTAKGALLAVRPVLILRAFLSLVLLASGIGKLISPPDPTVLLPPLLGSLASVGGFLVVLVSALEIGAAVLLWASRRVRTVASMTVSALAILFLSVSATNAGRDEYLRDCGCFGRGSSLATGLKPEVALLALVAQAAVLGWAAHLLRGSDPAPARRGESWRVTRIWLLLLAGAAAIGLFTRAGHLRSLMAEERVLQSQAGELGLAAAFPGTTFLGDESYWRRPFSQEPCSLVVFSATCGACLEQATWWRDLVQAWEAEGQAIRFVGTSSAAQIQALVAQTGIPTDAVAVGDKKLLIYYGIDSVPTALRFNRDGLLVWRSDHATLGDGASAWLGRLAKTKPDHASAVVRGVLEPLGDVEAGAPTQSVRPGVGGVASWPLKLVNGRPAVARLIRFRPPLMPGVSGFDLLHVIDADDKPVAFVPLSVFRMYGRPIDLEGAPSYHGEGSSLASGYLPPAVREALLEFLASDVALYAKSAHGSDTAMPVATSLAGVDEETSDR